jgi:tripartite-type tricarboxylate transporter receptor subunit TctC
MLEAPSRALIDAISSSIQQAARSRACRNADSETVMSNFPHLRTVIAALVAMFCGAAPCHAQSYPSRNIQLLVGYAPGGTGDIVARLVAAKLQASFGQTVVVENRAGASGTLAAQSLVNAPPDGYTLMAAQTPEIAINPYFMKGVAYDPLKDMQPIALAAAVPLALVVPAKAPYSTVGDMIKSWSVPGTKVSFASAGVGTPGHFAGELLKLKTGGNLVHVPYKGAGPAQNDLIGGHVDFYFPGFPAAVPHMKAGTLKLLAVSSAKRSSIAPDIPTVAEAANIPNFNFILWVGFFAPKGTPPDVVTRLNTEINKILLDPETNKKLRDDGAEVAALSVDQFSAFMKSEAAYYQQIVKDAGLKPE